MIFFSYLSLDERDDPSWIIAHNLSVAAGLTRAFYRGITQATHFYGPLPFPATHDWEPGCKRTWM